MQLLQQYNNYEKAEHFWQLCLWCWWRWYSSASRTHCKFIWSLPACFFVVWTNYSFLIAGPHWEHIALEVTSLELLIQTAEVMPLDPDILGLVTTVKETYTSIVLLWDTLNMRQFYYFFLRNSDVFLSLLQNKRKKHLQLLEFRGKKARLYFVCPIPLCQFTCQHRSPFCSSYISLPLWAPSELNEGFIINLTHCLCSDISWT